MKFTVTIKVIDEEDGSETFFSMEHTSVGALLGYAVNAIHPVLTPDEEKLLFRDMCDGLPDDHPAAVDFFTVPEPISEPISDITGTT